MKTRVLMFEFQLFSLNPINGWDADLPDELYNEYIAALRRMNEVHNKLVEYMMPQAEEADRAYERYVNCNGLSLVCLPEGVG